MKKLLIALSLFCAMAIETVAQNAPATDIFHWGFKGGLNLTTYDSDADDFQARMGQWGFLCRWDIGDHFAIQPELFYSRMGVRSLRKPIKWYTEDAFGTADDNLNKKFRLMLLTDNIQLPIIFKYYVPIDLFGGKGLNVHAGPLASARFDYKISTSSPQGYLLDPILGGNGDNKDGINDVRYNNDNTLRNFARAQNKFTVHYVVGIGYDSPSGIGVDLRFQQGITPVWKQSGKYAKYNYNSHSHDRVWAFCFSYTF